MDSDIINDFESARKANPFWFDALLEATRVMTDRVKKYSGENHPYHNFVEVAQITQQSVPDVFKHYIAMKVSRLMTTSLDFSDERVLDTMIDLINYTLLFAGWELGELSPEIVNPDLREKQWKDDWADLWPIICIDLDGVVNDYDGWTGQYEQYPLKEGAAEGLQKLRDRGFNLVLCTARPDEDLANVMLWLDEHDLLALFVRITNRKPPAVVYLDDRALTFKGVWNDALIDALATFHAYWQI